MYICQILFIKGDQIFAQTNVGIGKKYKRRYQSLNLNLLKFSGVYCFIKQTLILNAFSVFSQSF